MDTQWTLVKTARLPAMIDDVWAVGDDLKLLGQSRVELMAAATQSPCTYGGRWRQLAECSLDANEVDKVSLCGQIWQSLHAGRRESLPTVVLMGRFGGEGKSFFLGSSQDGSWEEVRPVHSSARRGSM